MMHENIRYQTKGHWICFFWPAVIITAGIALQFIFPKLPAGLPSPTTLFVGVGLALLILNYIAFENSTITVTNSRLIIKRRMLTVTIWEVRLDKIEGIDLTQSFPGWILGYGSIVINGTGNTRYGFPNVAKPKKLREAIDIAIASREEH